jgi:hypothetical protein
LIMPTEMRARCRAWLLAISLLSAAALAQRTPTLDEIIERHVEALGGAERIHALKTLIIRGKHHEGGAIPPGAAIDKLNYMAFVAPSFGAIDTRAPVMPSLLDAHLKRRWKSTRASRKPETSSKRCIDHRVARCRAEAACLTYLHV